MHILDEKVKNEYDCIGNMEWEDSNNNNLTKRYLKKGQLKHNLS